MRGLLRGVNMDFQKIPVYCPKCASRVMTWNGITKMQISSTCQFCGTYSTFDPVTQKVKENRFKPERVASSGIRFS